MADLSGRVAVITGAAQGLGRALAFALGAAGCRLLLLDVDEAKLAQTAAELADDGRTLRARRLDVTDAEAFQATARWSREELGPADLVVNNAGAALIGGFDELSPEDFERLVRLNLFGVVNGARAFLPQLRETKGQLANVASIFGLAGPPGQTAYAAAKFGVRGFSEALRQELRPAGVSVMTIYPGGVRTNIGENAWLGAAVEAGRRERLAAGAASHSGTTAEAAAAVIVRGLRARRARVLVGPDAHAVDWLARLFPAGAGGVLARLLPTI